jgi:hypothetical protein
MILDKQTKKNIRGLMQDPRWSSFEFAFQEYLKINFLENSAKQSNEFDTIWYIAHNEGGKYHLNNFINQLETNAQND